MGELANYNAPSSVQEVSMGTVVSHFPIEKYRVNENTVDLMTILTKDPIVTKTCYHDKVGFRFHELPCAMQVGLQASVHYNFLVALWNSTKDGRQIVDNQYTIMLLSVPPKVYQRLVKKYELNGDLRQLVLQVYLDGEVKYQVMNFEVDNTKKPPYMADKGLFEQIKKEVLEYKPFIPFVVGSALDEKAFWDLWNKEGQATEQYNPNEQAFRNRGMVGAGGQGGGYQNQISGGYQPPQQNYQQGGQPQNQGRQQILQGSLRADDFNFEEAQVINDNAGHFQQAPPVQNQQVPPVQNQQAPPVQNQQAPPQNQPVQNQPVQNQAANAFAEKANEAADKSGQFFNNNTDFNFDA